MKIKIIKDIPVSKCHKPVVGGIYAAQPTNRFGAGEPICIIEVNGGNIGILKSECEVIEP